MISVLACVVPVEPTAQALLAEVTATPDNWPLTAEEAAGMVRVAAAVAVMGAAAATVPAMSSGTPTPVNLGMAGTGMRTGRHLPPGRPQTRPVPGTGRRYQRNRRKWW